MKKKMWSQVTRIVIGLGLLIIAAVAVQPAWATLPTPNQPILVVQDSTSANVYQNFVPEMLTTEGLNGFQIAQLGDLTPDFLASYDVVILPHLTLTAAQATLFQTYVNNGGTLVGFRPDLQLANVFGVSSLESTLQEAWLKMDTTTPYAPSSDGEAMRFHGAADLYSLNSASALATLYNSTTLATTSPAAAINTFGLGKAILFSFDLTQSIVLMRQGNPAWAGYPNTHDGFNTMRATQMFMDQPSGQFWNDLGDGALNDVPQADIQMRLFSNLVVLTNAVRRPLPKLWYFPNQNRAMLLMTGDDHSFPVSDALGEINNIASYGGLFSYNLWYPFTTVSNSQVNAWLAAGNSMGIHFNDTAESDSSGVGGSAASWDGMQDVMSAALTSFATTYPSAPYPVTTRNHFIIWVSNDADSTPDQVAQAKLFQNNGIQLDTSYSSFPNRWGYMTGSGLPMKFLDPAAGTVIPVYEQATQYEDDVQLLPNGYSLNWSQSTAQGHYVQSLSDSLTKYNTVTTMLFHPENWAGVASYVQSALQYAQAQSIPMSTTGTWLNFWQARAATTVSMPSFTSGTLTFTTTAAPAGLTLLVPFASGNNQVVSTFNVDGAAQSFTVAAYQGVTYASVVLASAGSHAISVTYIAAGRILGQISPSAASASTTVQVQGGSIIENVPVAADGTYVVGPLPAATYAVTPTSLYYTFSPTSQSVPLSTADFTNINFTAIFSETLFTTQTPVLTNQTDGNGVDEELGTAFTSDVPGQIAGIRFWKAPSESGTHTGNIWDGNGNLLASVTFATETASGWQEQILASPLAIAANTTYIVSVNDTNAYYVATNEGLSSQVINEDLRSAVGNNGVYATAPGQFPTISFEDTNYFRDIRFIPDPTYSVSGSISPSASGSGASLILSGAGSAIVTADSSGNYVFTGLVNGTYTVTPIKTGFIFSPTSAQAIVNNGNVILATFTATAVPTYTVSGAITATTGSGAGATLTLTLSGITIATTTADSYGNYIINGISNGNYTVTPTAIGYSFSPASAAVAVNNGNVTGVNFTASLAPFSGETLLTTQTPVDTNQSDGPGVDYELGTTFTSDVTGLITAVRFWKSSSENGTHIGNIWNSSGNLLTSVTFTNETASGWQAQALPSPLAIAANTTYIVSVNTTNAYYVITQSGLASQLINQDLRSVVGNNGVYATTPGQFPTNTFSNSNYFRDLYFVPISGNSVSSLTLNPTSVTGGSSLTGTVTLNNPAPLGGTAVALSATNPLAQPHTIQSVNYPGALQEDASINWASLGPPLYNSVPSGSVATVSGVPGLTATLTNKANLPLQYLTQCPGDNCDWSGIFNPGADVLWDSGIYLPDGTWVGNGPLTVTFSSPIRGLGFQIEPDELGPFTASMCAFDASGTQLGCSSFSGSGSAPPATFIGIYDDTQEISKVTIDGGGALYPHDFAIGDALVVNGEKQLAVVPASVTVPQGATSATFPITTNEVSTSASLTISGNDNTTQTAMLTLTPPVLSSIVMNANTVPGGTSSTGTVTLASPAPSGGAVVVLTNDVPVAQPHTIQAVTYPTALQANGSESPANLQADGSIYWSTLGPTLFTTIPSGTVLPVSGLPGLNVTLTNNAQMPLQYLTDCPGFDCDWAGNFNPGADVLWDSGIYLPDGTWVGNGPLTVTFSSPQRGLGFQIMPDELGAFTASMCAYDSSNTQLGCSSFSGLASQFDQAIPVGLYDDTQEISSVVIDAGGALYPHDFAIGDLFVTNAARPVVAVVPSSVTVPAGQTTATFPVTTSAVNTSTFVNITGSYSGTQTTGTVQVTSIIPVISTVSLSPNSVTGGSSTTGTVTLSSPAVVGGAVVKLASDNAAASVPASITVPAHATTATFTVTTTTVTSTTTPNITAGSNGTSATAQLTVTPPSVPGVTQLISGATKTQAVVLPSVLSVSMSPGSVQGGAANATGTVTLKAAAPAGGIAVTLSASLPSGSVPASVKVAAGATTAKFTVLTKAVPVVTVDTITATLNGSANASLTIDPPAISSVMLAPASLIGGATSAATVKLNATAPAGGVIVNVASGSTAVATLSVSSVTVPSGSSSTTFTVTSIPVGAEATSSITATLAGGGTQSATLTVDPPTLSSLTLGPATVKHPASSTGTVTISGAAPAGGVIVNLSSSTPSVATVPSTATVPAGTTSVSFTVATLAPGTSTISASRTGSTTRKASLKVN